MTPVRRLGVVGTLVWDRIWEWRGGAQAATPTEAWGGISYSLAALSAACPPGWRIEPVLKLGHDLEPEARAFLSELPGVSLDRVVAADAPTNRVELRYWDPARRCERLTGGVPAWTAGEILPLLDGVDALFLNFVSGFEMPLDVAERVAATVHGPVYCDVHSLMLGREPDGRRVLRPLPEWRRWADCCDVLQMNDEELRVLAGEETPFAAFAAEALTLRPQLVVVTRGAAGAEYAATRDGRSGLGSPGPADLVAGHVAQRAARADGDPTGCGDVWGATLCAVLLSGATIADGITAAHAAAAAKLGHRGADGLRAHLAAAR